MLGQNITVDNAERNKQVTNRKSTIDHVHII